MQKSTDPVVSDLMSATVTAATLGISTSSLPRWSAQYGLPEPVWLGGSKWYSSTAIREWLQSPARSECTRRCGETHHRSTYPKEFVARAITAHMEGKSTTAISRALNVPMGTISKWISGGLRNQSPTDKAMRAAVGARHG